jgi:hypothetical protein
MTSDGIAPSRGIVCLGNDVVLDWTIAFCESVHRHNPGLPVTLIPFDENCRQTEAVLRRYGYRLLDDPMLAEMDALGVDYFGQTGPRSHVMRKFCAWKSYDTFLYLDADIVVLRDLAPYFEAFERTGADFAHFACDMVQVYREGPLRERMIADHDSAGFNSGAFLARRDQLDAAKVRSLAAETGPLRPEFVDNLEQTLINYCVDVAGLRKADANDLVPDLAAAGALMRLVGSGDDLTLSDRRVTYSGRKVSLIHWAGYELSSLMPYRRTFLRYRLAGAGRRQRLRYLVAQALADTVMLRPRYAYHTLRATPYRLRSWLSARGLVEWRGSQT